jgi:DNA-binding NarL/FixJ family response regulator
VSAVRPAEQVTGQPAGPDAAEPVRSNGHAPEGLAARGGPHRGPIRVLIVDDHALVRAAVRHALEATDIEVVGEACSAEEALAVAGGLRPEIVLLDLDLPAMHGLELIRELRPRLPNSRIIVLSASLRSRDVVAAFRRGADGYLGKDLGPSALQRSIRGVRRGELALPRLLAAELVAELLDLLRRPGGRESDDGLTEREQDVLRLLAEGLTDREIADVFRISPRTVESHVSSILRKFGLRNRAEASRRYHQGI